MNTTPYPAVCKICKNPLTVHVDAEYGGDIPKLVEMATHNRCYDRMTIRRNTAEAIEKVCTAIHRTREYPTSKADQVYSRCRQSLEKLTKEYAKCIADFNLSSTMVWDEPFPQSLFDHPENWWTILKDYRTMARTRIREIKAQKELEKV